MWWIELRHRVVRGWWSLPIEGWMELTPKHCLLWMEAREIRTVHLRWHKDMLRRAVRATWMEPLWVKWGVEKLMLWVAHERWMRIAMEIAIVLLILHCRLISLHLAFLVP